jgi:hypothetical protein
MTITITIPNTFADCKPTVIRYEKNGERWNRYWAGYDRCGHYVSKQDREAKGGPESEVKWAKDNGFQVEHS